MPPFYEINAKADDDHAEILIYDEIGDSWWNPDAIAAKRFVKELQQLDASTINLRINSPGGSVFDGNAIFNALRDHKAKITTYVDGLAASIASVIALAGDRVVMQKNALLMIHNPYTIALGDADEMRKVGEFLDKVRATIVTTYEGKTGQDAADIEAAMDAETWYTASEAIDFGLADAISDDDKDVSNTARFEVKALERFRRPPVELVAALARKPREDSPTEPEPAPASVVSDPGNTLDPNREAQLRDLMTRYPIH